MKQHNTNCCNLYGKDLEMIDVKLSDGKAARLIFNRTDNTTRLILDDSLNKNGDKIEEALSDKLKIKKSIIKIEEFRADWN